MCRIHEGVMVYTYNPLKRWRQEDREFKVILYYTGSFRLAWLTWGPVFKNKSDLFLRSILS